MKEFTVDNIFDKIGHFKCSQKLYVLSLCMLQIFGCHHMLLNIYAGLKPDFFECQVEIDGIKTVLLNKCLKNSVNDCNVLYYNKTSFKSYASEWNLVCDQKYKVAAVQTIWMGGVMTGALLLGGLADYIGRVKTLFMAILGLITFEGFASFSATYIIYLILRFLGGMMNSLLILVSFVLSQELIGVSARSFCGIAMSLTFSVGIAVLSLLAANVPDWRTLTLFVSLEGIIFLYIPFLLPESPRWLSTQGRLSEAKEVLVHIAKRNNSFDSLPKHWELKKCGGKKSNENIMMLFNNPFVLKLTLIQLFSWFVNSTVYYALTMAASSLQGNVYVTTTLNGLVEIPAGFLSYFIIDRLGRKFAICSFMIVGGTMCVGIPLMAVVSKNMINVMALVGKLSISASFSVIFIHSGEIFPTVIRNTGIGLVSVAARIGGMMAPFILILGDQFAYMHFVVLGLLSIMAGLLNTLMPETLGKPLPETFNDMLAFKEKSIRGKGYARLPLQAEDELFNEDVTKEAPLVVQG